MDMVQGKVLKYRKCIRVNRFAMQIINCSSIALYGAHLLLLHLSMQFVIFKWIFVCDHCQTYNWS